MALDKNDQHLVDGLVNQALEGRYRNLQHINPERGFFSVVFRAYDEETKKDVAIKFFSLRRDLQRSSYRRDCFHREHQILKALKGEDRCLQVLSEEIKVFTLHIDIPNGGTFDVPCEYFVVEWVDGDIEHFFFNQIITDALARLALFHQILLAVDTLHGLTVFHRDLKYDNVREVERAARRVVIAIDLGAAARLSSPPLTETYLGQAGHLHYSAPEACTVLASNRHLAPYTDLYALGCMLFELFNPDAFFSALEAVNPMYEVQQAAMASYIRAVDPALQVREWLNGVRDIASGIAPVMIDGEGSVVPPGIAGLLNEVLHALTHVDFRRRSTLRWTQARIMSAMKVLVNQAEYDRRLNHRRRMREARLEGIELKKRRLALAAAARSLPRA
jgi:serine/threonine protein kinase